METFILKTQKDAREADIKPGDQWVFEGWPAPPANDNQVETLDERMERAEATLLKIEAIIDEKLAKQAEEKPEKPEKRNRVNRGQEKKEN